MQHLSYPPDKKIQNYQFSFRSKLGKGAYGTVYAGKNTNDNSIVALKIIDKKLLLTDYANQLIASEIEIMKKINDSHVVKLLDVLQSANNTYIITEYCNGGDLREFIKARKVIPEEEALKILKDLLQGIKALLKQGIIHRDIKPANILIHDSQFKITDFGFAKQIDQNLDTIMNSLVGTPLYMSPQILKRGKYSSKCDIWSLGLIMYEMLYGMTPWHSQNLVELMNKLDSKPLSFPTHPRVSDSTKQMIKGCLQIREEKRWSWEDLFKAVNFNSNENKENSSPKQEIHAQTYRENLSSQNNNQSKYSLQMQRFKQRTESLCQQINKHNRSYSNTAFQTNERSNRYDNKTPVNDKSKQTCSYFDLKENLKQNNIKQERERSNSQNYRFHTQRNELTTFIDKIHNVQQKLNSNNDSCKTTSAMQSHSTNTSNKLNYELDLVKVSEFQLDENNKALDDHNTLRNPKTERVKRTNSLSRHFQQHTFQGKTHLQQLIKVIENQLELIPNQVGCKIEINTMVILHRDIINYASSKQIYTNQDLKDLKLLINNLISYLNLNTGEHSSKQSQTMLLLLLTYHKVVVYNIKNKTLNIDANLIETIKKNIQIQQNQLTIESKQLREHINQLM
ncbi:unnamed protein product (macronuclear) [Paramecium tetraurelia]|uniref:Protein kinase domain-containing protein n=1 Tax=Paramecium tetraurelia TaxID=5888 RepID=A0CKP6_PARTE|nr:uncharacterized protein GSPATT00001077001 [Paramecium tetraurelia]CAK71363.1 unnamed protein product [Paramecium tetraurelia]|eukprot:XP_001438760.1 hypothetical protein (macronuclear) [Paramecium tetraurelia strain d4-2]